MSEQVAQTTTPPRRPVLEIVQRIRSQPGGGLGIVQRFRAPAPPTGSAQLTGSEDFLIGLGVGALIVVVVGVLTFEIWAPRLAARLGKAAVTGAVGALPGPGAKGLLGFGILSMPAVAGRGGRTEILSPGGPLGKLAGRLRTR